MQRRSLDLLRCPKCLAGSLVPEDEVTQPALTFGPAHCIGCRARFSVAEGLIDFVDEGSSATPIQQAVEKPWVARSWERYLRPAFDTLLMRGLLDRDQEYAATRDLLGTVPGTLVDLGCGPGVFLLRLASDRVAPHLIGIDASRPMVEEAIAQVRENALAADFLRAVVPPLPFQSHSVSAIVANGLLHFVEDVPALLKEVARVLKPTGRFVASTFDSASKPAVLNMAGVFPRSEEELRSMALDAGLIRVERRSAGPMVVLKAELP